MKKFFTLFTSLFISFYLLAYDGSGLSISTLSTGMNFKVELDGRNVFMNGNTVTMNNLAEGYHNIRIFRKERKADPVNGYGGKEEIIYSSSVFLSRTNHTDIVISRSGKVYVDSYRISPETIWYDDGQEECHDNTEIYNGNGFLISAREFQAAKETIRREWYEASRLALARSIIDKNKFSTQQVMEIMYLFTFEKNRLEVAKYAYRKTADKQNYFRLNDALTFSSSKNELARFIRESR